MLGIRYAKTSPTTYVLHYERGRLLREGAGLSFLYFAPTSTLVEVPMESADLPFVFNEVASDFQEVTIQGQVSYRVRDPKRLAGLLDFSVDARGEYISDDPELLKARLVQAVQVLSELAQEPQQLCLLHFAQASHERVDPLPMLLVDALDQLAARIGQGHMLGPQVRRHAGGSQFAGRKIGGRRALGDDEHLGGLAPVDARRHQTRLRRRQ